MRKLLNTVYILQEQAYLTLDGENLVCKIDGETKLRIPFENVENIVCFNYLGCSPALMGKCVSKTIPINFISPQGKFLAKVCGETKGNVFLRVQQINKFRAEGLLLTQNTMAAKFSNCRQLIRRTLHDNAELREDENICNKIFDEFGLDYEQSHIITGHVPVESKKGESPIKAGGKHTKFATLREPLNQSAAALNGSFSPTDRFGTKSPVDRRCRLIQRFPRSQQPETSFSYPLDKAKSRRVSGGIFHTRIC